MRLSLPGRSRNQEQSAVTQPAGSWPENVMRSQSE
jgi:hypothetical protein